MPGIACKFSTKTNPDLPELKMKQMNPAWKAKNGTIDKNNEKAVAWLCDTGEWTAYATPDNSALQQYVRYAIGGPSIEMYAKSYTEAAAASNVGGSATWGFADNAIGYTYGGSRVSNAGKNQMFTTDCWWLASPDYANTNNGIFAYNNTFTNYFTYTYGVAPLVCLKSDFQLNLQ